LEAKEGEARLISELHTKTLKIRNKVAADGRLQPRVLTIHLEGFSIQQRDIQFGI